MENLTIDKVEQADVIQLQQISVNTFFETFSAVNTEEDMNTYLNESLSAEKLTTELSNDLSQFYFAALNGEVIGYLKLNLGEAQTEIKDTYALEIERIYVLQGFHGKKVGQLLYNKAIQIANEISAKYVWLGVWEKNQRAISFYKKNGFIEFDQHIFRLGADEQIDLMMKKILTD
ncbi:GNAT family N-acetyltransferase [Mucilaginibacter rubeus]|uniref:GNAT family N-acetyltransferase n=1 Tax=Mucilaginibacter rubeus TaxID=2027860 RepID=A0A5C1I4I0_9SPHI|nr:GNAT family N-acetyltransferase [Mucilaginibacter rubeus]QEM12230.1 GNAT family N-acetyltransferase [Mucilaginibacter rubeus]